MKTYFIGLIFFFSSLASFSQEGCDFWGGGALNFDQNGSYPYLMIDIDSSSNMQNSWQIGKIEKTVINKAQTEPNAIITNLQGAYPINDSSTFLLKHNEFGGIANQHTAWFSGYYHVQSDTLTDYGKIELSLDQQKTWINLLTDTVFDDLYFWYTPVPVLSGNSNGWQQFVVDLTYLGNAFDIVYGDTVYYRFTFVSDSINNNQDGLSFDSFQFCNYVEGINELRIMQQLDVFPNPTNGLLNIKLPENFTQVKRIWISDQLGQVVLKTMSPVDIDVSTLASGLYRITLEDEQGLSLTGRFVKE